MASTMFVALVYVLFFLSGAAALVYQVVWVRSLTLVFGGSHLAVTAVLSTFMAGLAIGGYAVGRRVDRIDKPLRLYALLELGIAISALAFEGLMRLYPAIYVALAQGRDEATAYLTAVRMLFAFGALIVPTALMGGTLPVLSRFVSARPEHLRSHLSMLYGFNTLGAVFGALTAGFFLLRLFSVSTTVFLAVATNAVIGVVSLTLQRKMDAVRSRAEFDGGPSVASTAVGALQPADTGAPGDVLRARLVLLGIGVSGFCALGYEVLWTRILTVAVGASVYGFTIILVAFLTGIALGSKAYGLLLRTFRIVDPGVSRVIVWFGITQVIIGIAALLVTVYLRDVPANAVRLFGYFLGTGLASFEARAWASFTLSFLYMLVPAFFMGAAFPLAGEALVRHRQAVGRGIGEVLASNTVGAILGAAVSGLVLIQMFGIERSLQMLAVTNVGLGLVVLGSLHRRRALPVTAAVATLGALTFLAVTQDVARAWDRKYFAIFRSNQPEAFRTPEMVREAVENTDVLFYAEGIESIVSVIRVKGGEQAFITNGRVEASSHLQAQQVQFTLGHLPMLLNRNPREVLVVGLGSGMTAGATAVHPSVERVTVAEIEPQVVGVARTFDEYNDRVLDNPKVRLVFNDGRNFLLTTNKTFDVITADPIHPWFRGAGYLYSSQYFELAARRLRPGGVIAQWLPLYELTPGDLASVVRTLRHHFTHTLLWLTHFDAVIAASNTPFAIDEAELQRRIEEPTVAAQLRNVTMGTSADFLSYFIMGDEGMKELSRNGTLNTDDRLYLEFSAPFSIATPAVMAANIDSLAVYRENLHRYLAPATHPVALEEQRERWREQLAAGRIGDRTLSLFLGGNSRDPAFLSALRRLNFQYPSYAPGRFLAGEYHTSVALEPRLLQRSTFALTGDDGRPSVFEMSAVLVPVSRTRASVMFVDNRARVVYGQSYVDNYERDGLADRVAGEVMAAIQAAYDREVAAAREGSGRAPAAAKVLEKIRAVIGSKVQVVRPEP